MAMAWGSNVAEGIEVQGRNQTYMEIPTIQLLGHYVTEFEL